MVTTMIAIPFTPQTADQASQPSSQQWEMSAIRRVHMLHSQLDAAIVHAKKSSIQELSDMDFMSDSSPYMQQLLAFYREHLGLARLLDSSDLLLHAEGPGASQHSPRLGSVNWLCASAEKHLKNLMRAMLPMDDKSGKLAISDVDLRLTGLAPGSLYAGFSLAGLGYDPLQPPLHEDDGQTVAMLRHAMHALPMVPQFVQEGGIDRQIMEALPDPALRDAAMVAACEMAPTGNKGIHTIEISSPTAEDSAARGPQPLGQRERVVLKEALRNHPMMRSPKRGSFVGTLRAIDLDKNRITLRNISTDITALRCMLPAGDNSTRQWLDKQVRVEGEYETNAIGQPRMMRVISITPVAALI